jgi:hypothetical protein
MNFFPNTHLTDTVAKSYNNKLNKWISLMPPHKNTLQYIFTHPNLSTVTLRQHLTQNDSDTAPTLNSYIKAILSAAEHNLDNNDDYLKSEKRWKELRQITYEYANSYRLEQKPSPTQSQKSGSTLTLTDIIKVRDELPDGSLDKLLISFYTYIPPVRADFFATQILKFGETPSYHNYILFNSDRSRLVITDFKTSDIYKSIEHDLPSELHKQLSASLTLQPRIFLFDNRDGKCFTRKLFSEWATNRLTTLFKKKFTLTLFRHIYISTLDLNTPASELLEISRKMGHSITQQMLYKWKEQKEDAAES